MKNILNMCIILSILFIIFKNSSSYLIFPFKTKLSSVKDNEENITLLIDSLLENNIYINLEIGEPKQNIDLFLHLENSLFILSENFFNKNNSATLIILNNSQNYYSEAEGILIKDFIHFDKYSKEEFKMIISKSISGNLSGILGLGFGYKTESIEYNFIMQLKANKIINNYNCMINYTSEYEGNLIIGEYPHIIDPINYKIDDLRLCMCFSGYPFNSFQITLNNIIFQNKSLDSVDYAEFRYEINYISGTKMLLSELDIYFSEFLQKSICFKQIILIKNIPHTYFYCDKHKLKDNLKSFPPLLFQSLDLVFTFELNYEDLFIEKGDKLILMIFFDQYGSRRWEFGKPFLKKYQFVMNRNSKTIGYYKKFEQQ